MKSTDTVNKQQDIHQVLKYFAEMYVPTVPSSFLLYFLSTYLKKKTIKTLKIAVKSIFPWLIEMKRSDSTSVL